MTADDFYGYVKQRVPGWKDAVNSFRVDFNCDIYITGSNAYLLSPEYPTYLSGRGWIRPMTGSSR